MSISTKTDFSSWLSNFINTLGLSQRSIAIAVGKTESAVSGWVLGKSTPPNVAVVKVKLYREFSPLATELGIDIKAL